MKNPSQQIVAHFKTADPILFQWFDKITPLDDIVPSEDYFSDLCESIVSQQLSTKVADVIWARMKALFENGVVTPEKVLQLSEVELRSCGLSFAKIRAVKDLSAKVIDGTVRFDVIDSLPNNEVIEMLIQVKGIGKWTAEMFLIFGLARPDVFSFGDLGLKKGVQKVYGLEQLPTEKELLELEKAWEPYRSVASRVLWKSLEVKE